MDDKKLEELMVEIGQDILKQFMDKGATAEEVLDAIENNRFKVEDQDDGGLLLEIWTEDEE